MTEASEKTKHITEVEDDEAMERLFSKKMVKELKKIAHDSLPKPKKKPVS